MMTHHALLIESRDPLAEILERFALEESEIFVFPYRTIGINEVRSLVSEALRLPTEGQSRSLVIEVDAITTEAQNALLKLLEEPPITTRFLFILRTQLFLLPTLESRFFRDGQFDKTETEAFTEFRALTVPQRLKVIAERIDKKDDAWSLQMRIGLHAYMVDGAEQGIDRHGREQLGFILARLGTRGASTKMLLESLAFLLPVVQ